MMNETNGFAVPVVIIAVCAAAAYWMIANKPEPDRRPPPRPEVTVDAKRLEPQGFQVKIVSRGTVEPSTKTTLVAEVSGQIVAVSANARAGSFFAAGEVLMSIDRRDYESAAIAADSDLIQATYQFSREQILVQNLDTDIATAEATVAQAALRLAEERARAAQADADWRRLNPDVTADPLVLRVPHITAAEADLAAARADLAKRRRDVTLSESRLAAASAAVRSAEARVMDTQVALERTVIKAPYAGRVMEQTADIGQFVSPGTGVLRIYAADYAEVRLPLSDHDLAHLELPDHGGNADPATFPYVVLTRGIGRNTHAWSGRVVRTDGAYDTKTRQLFVTVRIDDPYAANDGGTTPLIVGQFVNAEIEGRVLHDVFVLPLSAVRQDNEILIIDAAGTLRRRSIDPIWTEGGVVVVKDNISAGEQLCLTALPFAVEGASVTVRVETGTPLPSSTAENGDPAVSGKDGNADAGELP